VILTTHDLEQGLRAATRAMVMDRGKVVLSSDARDPAIREAYSRLILMEEPDETCLRDRSQGHCHRVQDKESISSMFWFGLLVLVIFSFSFDSTEAEGIKPGILWVAFSFAGILGLNRSLSMESDNDCLQGLLLARWIVGIFILERLPGTSHLRSLPR